MGVSSIYIASKYEDVLPLHSNFVSEKISHGEISPEQILQREKRFLQSMNFEMDFVTNYDFY
ncbi:MAG: hypothetical protein ACK55Z_37215 [bacterium]